MVIVYTYTEKVERWIDNNSFPVAFAFVPADLLMNMSARFLCLLQLVTSSLYRRVGLDTIKFPEQAFQVLRNCTKEEINLKTKKSEKKY